MIEAEGIAFCIVIK